MSNLEQKKSEHLKQIYLRFSYIADCHDSYQWERLDHLRVFLSYLPAFKGLQEIQVTTDIRNAQNDLLFAAMREHPQVQTLSLKIVNIDELFVKPKIDEIIDFTVKAFRSLVHSRRKIILNILVPSPILCHDIKIRNTIQYFWQEVKKNPEVAPYPRRIRFSVHIPFDQLPNL